MAEKKRFLLRLDGKVWDALKAAADQNLRSVNGQIEFFLREALRERLKRLKHLPPGEADTAKDGESEA